MAFDIKTELDEFSIIRKSKRYQDRNFTYWLLRNAMEGKFRWPNNWPDRKPKLAWNIVKPIVLRFSSLVMGRSFSISVPPLQQDTDSRTEAQVVEKWLYRTLDHSQGWATFSAGAQDASLLGNAIFKVYLDDDGWPSFSQCTPEYFYGFPSSSNYMGDMAKVYYAYYIDRLEAEELYPEHKGTFKTERELSERHGPDKAFRTFEEDNYTQRINRRIPVIEMWTKKNYALIVGGQIVENGDNPYGFVPFVSIPNIRISGQVDGQGDVEQVLTINEELNQMLSHRAYIVRRWLNPTMVWENAPQNYPEIVAGILGGGGVLSARGGRTGGRSVYFLEHQTEGPEVTELIERLRSIALENANMNDIVLSGQVQGSINTGVSLEQQSLPVITAIEEKRRWWEMGLRRLLAQLLSLSQEGKAKKEYGTVRVFTDEKKARESLDLVEVGKETLKDYREVDIVWPGTLARDDAALARLEIEKHAAGIQSLFTTLEHLGEDYPDDEIERIATEREDPRLAPKEQAGLMQAEAAQMRAAGGPNPDQFLPPEDDSALDENQQIIAEEAEELATAAEEPAPKRRRKRKRPVPKTPEAELDGDELVIS